MRHIEFGESLRWRQEMHPSMFLQKIETFSPHLIHGREASHIPKVNIVNDSDLKVKVDEKALLFHIGNLVIPILDEKEEIVLINPSDRISAVNLLIINDLSEEDEGVPLGRNTTLLDQVLIELKTNRDWEAEIEEHRFLDSDYVSGLSMYFGDDEFDWLDEFWSSLKPEDPKSQEIILNMTLFHEIQHISHSVQNLIMICRAISLTEKRDLAQGKSLWNIEETSQAWDEVDQTFAEKGFIVWKESDAEAYSIESIRKVLARVSPKIIKLLP